MAAGSADADLCQSATARPDRAFSGFIRAAETESQISSSISACLVLGRDGEQHEPGGHLPGGRRLSWAPMHQIWTPARFWARARSALVVVVVVRRPSFVPSFVYHPSRLLTSHFPFSFSSASCLIGVRLGALISYVARRSDVPSGLVLAASRAGSEQSDDEPTKLAPTPAPVVLPRKSRFADEDVEQKADSDVRPPLLAHSLDPRSLPYDRTARGACARPVEPGEGREGRVLGLAVLCRLTYPGPLARALQDDWDASSADEATKKASATPAVAAAAPRKKGNLKAKLAEKAAQEEERKKAVRTRPPNLSSSRPAQSRCCVRIGTADKRRVRATTSSRAGPVLSANLADARISLRAPLVNCLSSVCPDSGRQDRGRRTRAHAPRAPAAREAAGDRGRPRQRGRPARRRFGRGCVLLPLPKPRSCRPVPPLEMYADLRSISDHLLIGPQTSQSARCLRSSARPRRTLPPSPRSSTRF
jgi:hypothetical protein